MKFKKITALLSTAAMMLSLTPMSFAAADWYNYDPATKKATISEVVVPGNIDVKLAGAEDSTYADSKSVKFESNERTFDFKATLDMKPVQEKFEASVDILSGLGKYDDLKDREVKGEFTVTVIPGTYITIPQADIDGSGMYGFTTESTIYEEIDREVVDGNLVIKVGLKSGTTVDMIKNDGLKDIAYESENVAVTKAGTIKIYGTVKGYIETVDLQGDSDINVRADFVAKEDNKEKIFATIYSKTSSTGGLGGGSTTTKKNATVTFYDGAQEHLKETVDITNGAYTFDVSSVAVPEAEANKVFTGWYEDKECTVKASDKESITKNTDFYAGWLDTKYDITYKIDGVKAPVNTGTTGSIIIDGDDVVVTEEGTTVKLSQIKAEGVVILGWYLDPEHTIKADDEVTITEDTTFYAVTKEIDVPVDLEKDDHFAYIIGYPEGDVRPENSITREEVATIFFRLLTEETRTANFTKTNAFADVEDSRWSNNAISTMAKLGIITGYEDGTFKPANAITRAEFATIAARFEEEVAVGTEDFTDIAGHWAESYIKEAAALQWINGYEDGSFRPGNNITRAEVMTIVNRMLQRKVSSDYILETATFWTDNPKSAWYYEDVMEATNSHTYERLGEGQIEERWVEMQPNRDWSELEK